MRPLKISSLANLPKTFVNIERRNFTKKIPADSWICSGNIFDENGDQLVEILEEEEPNGRGDCGSSIRFSGTQEEIAAQIRSYICE